MRSNETEWKKKKNITLKNTIIMLIIKAEKYKIE